MKKNVSMMIAGVMMLCFAAEPPSALRSAELASGMPTTSNSSATAGPTAPATISAPRPPTVATSAAMIAGATAPPRKPAKVWIENARPIRLTSICAERIA